MENNLLAIWLWNREVGRLYWDDSLSRAVSAYSPTFLRGNLDIAPLVASIHSPAALKPLLGSKDKLYQGLPPFLADSLPDKWGNLVFENWRNAHHLRAKQITPVDKLSFIGNRGMGALEFRPAIPFEQQPADLPLTDLYRLSLRIFTERTQVQILPEESLTMQSLYAVGTSAGGQHPKALIAINRTTNEIRSGQMEWGDDFDYYIIKFAERSTFPSTQVEYAFYLMVQDLGIDMMPSRLIEVDGALHFLTRRFDRQNGKRIHIQTLAAMSETAYSYEDLMRVARQLGISQEEQEQLFLRIVMNIWGGNVDDHTKNFAFMLSDDGLWHITPAYDITFTTDLDGPAYFNRHELSLRGKTDHITYDDLLRFAQDNSIKRASAMLNRAADTLSQWQTYARQAAVPEPYASRIAHHLRSLITPTAEKEIYE